MKEDFLLHNSTDASNQPFLVTIKGKKNSIGRCVGVVNNTIVDATFKDGLELSHESIDAVLGEPVTEILWCKIFYPPSDKIKPNTSIQSFEDLMQEQSYDLSKCAVKNTHYYPTEHHSIPCKILFKNCAGQQLLGTFTKLVSRVLSTDIYAQLATRVELLKQESVVGIKTCASVLSAFHPGNIQKKKNCPDIVKITIKEWIVDLAMSYQPFLVSV